MLPNIGASPDAQAIGSVRIAELPGGDALSTITNLVTEYYGKIVDRGLWSGGIVVAMGDKPIFEAYHSITSGETFNEHTLFNSCSVSKVITALAIHQLVRNQQLSLDTKINNMNLGSIDAIKGEIGEVTIKELLNHTSGIIDDKKDPSKAIFNHKEKSQFNYSNLGYQLLAEIIKKKSPYQSFHKHVQCEIFDRYHMSDSLMMTAQFDDPGPSFATPQDFPKYKASMEIERKKTKKEIETLENLISKGQGDVSAHRKMMTELNKKMKLLELPPHLQPLPSGDCLQHSFVTPPQQAMDVGISPLKIGSTFHKD